MLKSPNLDALLHALAEPTRRAMVERLSRGPAAVSDLAKPFDLTLAAVVQHVQVLERSGLIYTAKVGRVRTCQLAPSALDVVDRWIADRRALWDRRLDRLGAFLDADDAGTTLPPRSPAPSPKREPRR
jgi:DNA-binding transcriptional ArsR family regulator